MKIPKEKVNEDSEVLMADCDFEDAQYIDTCPNTRIYFKANVGDNQERYGFDFFVLHFVEASDDTENVWDSKTLKVQVLFRGIAQFDGLRHLWMGLGTKDEYPYHYYPKTKTYMKIFAFLRMLEHDHCEVEYLDES